MTVHLRPYQLQALEAEARHRAEHPDETRLAIVMATGLGKTIIMAERARRHIDSFEGAGNRVLLLVHTDELAQQAEAKVRLIAERGLEARAPGLPLPITVGVVKADRDECTADIVIASVQTLLQPGRRERITDVGLVLVDECELYAAPQWKDILRHYGCFGPTSEEYAANRHDAMWEPIFTPALGFTATLERGDGQGLGGIWQNVCFSRDISWGVRKGYLVQPIGHRLEIDPSDLGRGEHSIVDRWTTSADTLDSQLIEAMAPEKIVEKWLELAGDRPTIAFMPLVRSAVALAAAFSDKGIMAAVISGDMPNAERRWKIQAYLDGRIQVLVNAMVLTRGFDAPKTSCVIIGRPTKSRNLGIQMAGRGLRPVPGVPVEDQDCVLIYVQDATTDLFTHADLSDKPMDRKAEGALTALEDQWDLGKELDEANRQALWTGQVDAKEFDPLVARSSKVWRHTAHGTPFLPISKDGEYVFVVGTSVFVRERLDSNTNQSWWGKVKRLHKDLPDLELALSVAEDEAQERGGDLGRLLADKGRPWRKAVPSTDMKEFATRLGLFDEMGQILADRRGGKAGRLSDLISQVQATRALEPMVKRIKEATA
jgi:superfamily II DNA or RNA helicase